MTNESACQYLKKVYLTTKNDSYREALSIALSAIRQATDDHLRGSTKMMTEDHIREVTKMVPPTEDIAIMPVITDDDGNKWRQIREDVFRDLFRRAAAETEKQKLCEDADYLKDLLKDAEARAEKAERERDTAIKKLRDFDCETCTNARCHVRNGTGSCEWEWHGYKGE